MKTYVVDASIVLTGILESRKSLIDKIKRIFIGAKNDKCKLVSSDFLKIEVANGLRFNEKDKTKAQKLFRHYIDLPIKYSPLEDGIYEKSLQISYELNTTVYDTSYHILAKVQNATFLTCDEEYYKKAKNLGNIELIK